MTFTGKLAMALFGWMMTGSTRKMIAADLDDIRAAAENELVGKQRGLREELNAE